jgi:hypothetical protein
VIGFDIDSAGPCSFSCHVVARYVNDDDDFNDVDSSCKFPRSTSATAINMAHFWLCNCVLFSVCKIQICSLFLF